MTPVGDRQDERDPRQAPVYVCPALAIDIFVRDIIEIRRVITHHEPQQRETYDPSECRDERPLTLRLLHVFFEFRSDREHGDPVEYHEHRYPQEHERPDEIHQHVREIRRRVPDIARDLDILVSERLSQSRVASKQFVTCIKNADRKSSCDNKR